MTLDNLLMTIGGLGLIALIWWFFFGKRDNIAVVAGDTIEILIDGGYQPSVIKLKKGKKIKISLLRKDPNSCLEEFILPDFKVSKYLPMGQKIDIEITPDKSGEFLFHCGMNMFHGKVIVE